MKFTKFLIVAGTLGISVNFVSACTNSASSIPADSKPFWENLSNQYSVTKFSDNQIKNNLQKAKLLTWRDGDTPVIQFYKADKPDELSNETSSIRIEGIDTPEKTRVTDNNVRVPSSQPELKYAEEATKFAEKTIPEGTDVYFWYSGAKSFNRLVGTIYYGFDPAKKTAINYGAQVVLNGLAIPLIKSVTSLLDQNSEIYVATRPIGIAANLAILNKLNIWSLDSDLNKSLKDVYNVRGVDSSWVSYLYPGTNNYKKYAKKGIEPNDYAQTIWPFYE
ncbi:thermonuclease family protein [Mycoplasma tullyi]|uniref:Thermonuclease family protein n=1 Tax=Mycoplasma tullyi TaxID=1612150 RepID=A0A7D7Y570_9MOLU|nr:thermonuclease family protein [Mycoplasma tullyi]QMT98557.1 thermonuclease family protein [Mycoplasma tullyi]